MGVGRRAGEYMLAEERLRILRDAAPNSWIALSEDEGRLVAAAATYEEVVMLAAKEGVEDPVLIKTPDEWVPLVF